MKNSIEPTSAAKRTGMMIALVALLATTLAIQAAPNTNPGILPIHSKPNGKTYGEWTAAWWQWALAIPEASNPLVDPAPQFAALNQNGPVWFLAGTFGGSLERSITIPTGKSIFMPIHNWIFGSGVFDCDPTVPGVTCDVPELRSKAAAAATGAEVVEAWIDGNPVNNIRDYRAISPEPFSVTFPAGAVFGIPAGTYYPQVTDGYWLMLAPLKAGAHTIRVHAVNTGAGLDYTAIYHLTIR
jgi:hypothetical protein